MRRTESACATTRNPCADHRCDPAGSLAHSSKWRLERHAHKRGLTDRARLIAIILPRCGAHESDRRRHAIALGAAVQRLRSEEHTSELQSHSDLVCRLLLEKKNRLV